jgi:cytochrome c peroxidase
MATGIAATSYYTWNKSLNISFVKLSTTADCASLAYKVPSDEQANKCRADLMKFIGERRNIAPLMVRLSWHDAGTYDEATQTGGPRACMRFDFGESTHGANAGLAIARDLLAPIKARHPSISNADLWSLAAICAIKVMGGPDIAWRAGRPDACCDNDAAPDGRLPDATQGCPHLRSVFHRMGMSDQEIVALSGAHAVGMCHPDRSGFIGPWTTSALDFDNAFFINLVDMKWKKTKQGNGLEVFITDSQPGIIMLPTDVALLTDEKMVGWVELYAKDRARWEKDFAAAFTKL